MFTWLIKKTETYRKLFEDNLNIIEKCNRVGRENENLLKINDNLKRKLDEAEQAFKEATAAGGVMVEEGKSSVTFEIDNELQIVVKSKINKDIVETLIDNDYIKSEFSEDEPTIQFAFILIANEATEQIIENLNTDEET